MKYFLAIQIITYHLLFLPAHAQEENWDTYMADFGGKPGSVLVNLALINSSPDKRYPYLVITGPRAHNCNRQGLPDKEEIDALEDILDATDNFITGVTAKVLIGTFTCNCERLNYYYVKDTMNIRNAITRMYNRNFKNYSYAIHIKPDPEWATYSTFLYPNEEMLNWMENNKVIVKMMQAGDSLTAQRDIHFELYFRSDTDRKSFAAFAVTKGYKTGTMTDPAAPSDPYQLNVSKYGYVKTEFIGPLSEELKKNVKIYHGFYNGWSAPADVKTQK